MRFFRNRSQHEEALSWLLGTTFPLDYPGDSSDDYPDNHSDSGSDNGNDGEDAQPDQQDVDEVDPEEAGNETTPIESLPDEILQHIFKMRLDDFRRVHRSSPESTSLGISTYWKDSLVHEDAENGDRTDFLNKVVLVCRRWLCLASEMSCEQVVVDGLSDDYDRANTVLGSSYPGESCTRGSLVRYLRLEVKEDYVCVNAKFVEKVIKLLNFCPNLVKLIIINESGLRASYIQDIWRDGIDGCSSRALKFLAWSVHNLNVVNTNLTSHLAKFVFLTELDLRDDDDGNTAVRVSLSLPKLRTYRLRARHSTVLRYHASWSMTSLEHVSLSIEDSNGTSTEVEKDAVLDFFGAHGQGLRYLKLKRLGETPDYEVVMGILKEAPVLEYLDIDINLLVYDKDYISHQHLNYIKISGARIDGENSRDKTVGMYMSRFVKTIREHVAFPCLTKIMFEYLREVIWVEDIDGTAKGEWQKWFALDEDRRPAIIDSRFRPLTLADVTTVVDRSFRIRRI